MFLWSIPNQAIVPSYPILQKALQISKKLHIQKIHTNPLHFTTYWKSWKPEKKKPPNSQPQPPQPPQPPHPRAPTPGSRGARYCSTFLSSAAAASNASRCLDVNLATTSTAISPVVVIVPRKARRVSQKNDEKTEDLMGFTMILRWNLVIYAIGSGDFFTHKNGGIHHWPSKTGNLWFIQPTIYHV